jgi:hypothetical protein
MMEGGRSRPSRSRPGKRSPPGAEKNAAKPRVKKLGELPGAENRSRGMRNCTPPMVVKMGSS